MPSVMKLSGMTVSYDDTDSDFESELEEFMPEQRRSGRKNQETSAEQVDQTGEESDTSPGWEKRESDRRAAAAKAGGNTTYKKYGEEDDTPINSNKPQDTQQPKQDDRPIQCSKCNSNEVSVQGDICDSCKEEESVD